MRLFELKTAQSVIDSIGRLWPEHRSAKKIARILDLTPQQVHKILERYFKDRITDPGRTTPDWMINKIKELWDSGLEIKTISRAIPDTDEKKVAKILARYYSDRIKRHT